MNVWRWLGLFFVIAAVTCFAGTQIPAGAGDKDKAAKDAGKDGKDAKDAKDAGKDKGDKDKGDKDKGDKDKPEKDKGDKDKKPEPPKGGDAKFTAFEPGKKAFYQQVTTETIQNMKVQGQDVKQEQKQTFYIKWTPAEKADKDGNWSVDQQVVAVMMNIDIGGNKIAYDSTLPPGKQPNNPMTDFFKALMEQKLTFTIVPASLDIKNIDGREKFIKSLAETNPAIKTLLDTIMSDAALKKMAEPTWWAVPQKGKGETWNATSTLDLGPIGKYDTKFKFTNEGQKDSLDQVKIEAELTYAAPAKDKVGGLPFTIKDASLSGKSTSGEALFDRSAGRIASSKLAMKLEGTLTIEVGNMSTEIRLDQTQNSTTKTFNDLPAEAVQKKQ